MLRTISAATLAVLTATAAHSAECSPSLRENWSQAAGEIMELNRQVMKAKNMGEAYDYRVLCSATKKMPGFLKLAKEYFPACEPLDAPQTIGAIERVNDLSVRFDRIYCTKAEGASAQKKR